MALEYQSFDLDRGTFVRRYVDAMQEGHAALFIGAGMSRPAGFVDWKGLLRECALELGLDIEQEHDLVAVAQYYLNRIKDRWRLNQILRDEFDRPGTFTPNHAIIGRLPIPTIWTTNFDSLLEQSFRAASRNVDVKSRDQDFSLPKKGREVVIYKMHGDIARPDEIIICKDDYERYARRHSVFQNALQGDLISKTFLFLGFSFTDPNIEYVLGHLRSLLEDSRREHYAVMRRARLNWQLAESNGPEAHRLFEYERNKQSLQIQDLYRYNIQTVLIDRYEEITEILEVLERRYHWRRVFVSGSANQYGDFGEDRMRDLCMHLGERLMGEGYLLITGMGLNIGDTVVKGALVNLFAAAQASIEKRLFLRPFPRNLPDQVDEEEFNRKYREDMLSKSSVAIFIAGTSRTHRESVGVLHEFDIARRMKRIPVPIGATGFAARHIWEVMRPSLSDYYGDVVPPALFERLNDSGLSNAQLLDAVFEVIERVSGA